MIGEETEYGTIVSHSLINNLTNRVKELEKRKKSAVKIKG